MGGLSWFRDTDNREAIGTAMRPSFGEAPQESAHRSPGAFGAFGVTFGIACGAVVAWVSRRIEWRALKSARVPKRCAG